MALRHLLRRQWWMLCGGALIITLLIGGVWSLCASPAQASVLAQEPTATLPPRHTPTPEPVTPTSTPEPVTPTSTPTATLPTSTPTPSTGEPGPPPPDDEPEEPTVTPTYVLLPHSGLEGGTAPEGVLVGVLLLAGGVILGAYAGRKRWGN